MSVADGRHRARIDAAKRTEEAAHLPAPRHGQRNVVEDAVVAVVDDRRPVRCIHTAAVDIVNVVADGEIRSAVPHGVVGARQRDDAIHILERAAQGDLVARQDTRRAQEGKRIDIRPVHDDGDTDGCIGVKVVDAVDQLTGREHGRIHHGGEQARPLLRHVDALLVLRGIKVGDLRCLADAQVVCARRTRAAARDRDDGEVGLRLEDDCNLLRLCRVVQMIVENTCIPLHRVTIEDAALLDILRTVRKEQRPARILRHHIPAAHHARAARGKYTVLRRRRFPDDARDAFADVRLSCGAFMDILFRRTALTYHSRPLTVRSGSSRMPRAKQDSSHCRRPQPLDPLLHSPIVPFLMNINVHAPCGTASRSVHAVPRAALPPARQHAPRDLPSAAAGETPSGRDAVREC